MLTDHELNNVRFVTGTHHLSQWQAIYGMLLGRSVETSEVLDAHRRMMDDYWRDHPAEKAEHDRRVAEFQAMTRSDVPMFRSKV